MLFSKVSILAALAALTQSVNAQAVTQTTEPVYFLRNQKKLEFGGIFHLKDKDGNPNVQGFMLAEAFSCAVKEMENLNYFPGSILNTNVRDDTDIVSNMNEIANDYGTLDVVMPVISVDQDSLFQFVDAAKKFKSPIAAYMPPGTLNDEIPPNEDLFFVAPVDSYQSKPLVSLARGLEIKRFGAIASTANGMKSLLTAFKEDGNKFTSAEDRIQLVCELTDPSNANQKEEFAICMKKGKINQIAIFSGQNDIYNIFQWLKNSNILNKNTLIFGSDNWANQETFDSLINDYSIDPESLNSTISATPSPGSMRFLSTCLANRTASIQPYENYKFLYENAMKCQMNSTLTPCEVGRASLTNATGTCACRSDETLASYVVDPWKNPGVNYVIDAAFTSGYAYHKAIFDCETVAASLNVSSTTICDPITGKITGSQIAQVARNFSFIGYTGKVKFMSHYRRYANYEYRQFNGYRFVKAGNWSIPDELTNLYDSSSISQAVASGKAANVDSSIIITPTDWDSAEGVAITVATSLGLLSTVATTLFVVVYRDHPVIKRASPLFCAMMLGGIAILYFQLYIWIGPQTAGSCVSKIWLPIFGFGMLMGPMLAKTFRIWKIFDNSKLRARRLLTGHLMGMSAAVISVNLILLIIWTAVDPLKPISLENNYYFCGSYNNNFQTGFIIVFAVYNGLLLILGSFLSYKTRSVVSSFNESTYIAYTMYNFLLCMAVLLPIYYVVSASDNKEFPRAGNNRSHNLAFVIRSVAFLFANTACLIILFGPKVYHVIKKTEDRGDLPTSNGGDNSGKKPAGSSKAGTSAPTGAKNSTLVGGGASSNGPASTYDGSRPGATIGEKSSQIASSNTEAVVTSGTTTSNYTGTASEATTEVTSGVFNAGATINEGDKDAVTSSVIQD